MTGVRAARSRMKRGMDLVGAMVGVMLLGPILLLVALAVRLDSPGPALFRQERLGMNGEVFVALKFRTMVRDAEAMEGGLRTGSHDPRITRVGRLLRALSLDELPQILNVLRGEMSLVGPRPAPVAHLDGYGARERRRLAVRPGMTGWAQVNGRNALTWGERIEKDLWYIDQWSPWLDLGILARTVRVVLLSEGVYSGRYDRRFRYRGAEGGDEYPGG